MDCRENCGACCIAITISSPMPGLPEGKEAGVRCPHLTIDKKCKIFNLPERPKVCNDLKPSEEMCGESFEDALAYLRYLEQETMPVRLKK
ncbi:YkgJ family cysteine cluster protein [Desulfuribacillus alkaliarsenatis]|uniref:Proteinase inhibitor n=1 Tax=Desulfuribacillus alkaliarsenatis TaxID=766136 RepID=A0A1E5G0K0_9FIRM|nr:YkgJ family cysteine cluster protein [Desulfuribacillus alkaliarsenatis]OEF96352.1 hypothetical protein BHF68_09385 [Desulfuribacillus alkaliarsenatis]